MKLLHLILRYVFWLRARKFNGWLPLRFTRCSWHMRPTLLRLSDATVGLRRELRANTQPIWCDTMICSASPKATPSDTIRWSDQIRDQVKCAGRINSSEVPPSGQLLIVFTFARTSSCHSISNKICRSPMSQ